MSKLIANFQNRFSIPKQFVEIQDNVVTQETVEIEESVKVQVGLEESMKIFLINKSLLCEASEYCRRRFAPESKYKEEAIILNGFKPLIFEIFLQWISNPAPIIPYDPDGLPQEPWLSNAATTWFLGKKLQCSDDFDRYALSQFIQNCAFMAFGPWELIEKEVAKGSLSRFSDHWVAWNHRLAGPDPNEYSGLRAVRTALTAPVRDPRTFDIEHWYSECGKYMRPGCLHDPITRLEKIEEAKRPKSIPPAEWGRHAELRCEVCLTADFVGT